MITKTQSFIKETQQELNKVTWPTRHELIGSTIVVIVTTMLLALFIGIVDFFVSMAVRFLIR